MKINYAATTFENDVRQAPLTLTQGVLSLGDYVCL